MDVVDAERAAAGRAAMDSILSQLFALTAGKKDTKPSAQQGTEATDQRESSICEAIYSLANAASPGTRMGSFLPGTERFVKVSTLGTGSHGVVTKARDSVTGETVAVKTLHPKPLYYTDCDDKEFESYKAELQLPHRLLREACFMVACRGHPSLVRLSAIGRLPDTAQYCLVMERVGPSLGHVLRHERGGKPFPERDVRRMMRQVLGGAKAMHDRGVVHRGIHSNNILVVGDSDGGGVKIGDFGEATSVSETDVHCSRRMSHVAPEYLLHAPGAVKSELLDSWSMGCLMLELLTGEDHFYVAEDSGSEGQLYRVFDVLGVPGKLTMKAIKPRRDLNRAKEVRKWRARQRRLGKQQRSRLDDMVPCDALSELGFEVLQGLLMINPKKRLTAAAALQHQWFAKEYDTDEYDPDDYDHQHYDHHDNPLVPAAREFVGALEELLESQASA
ncbi:hypothetical protein EJB05_42065, partial [Eragrostis curvula]